jgi:phospholipid/cholesterol/gamma-HCH transport system substrate-binding protein
VTVNINEDIKLPIDSIASISTKGILGDKIITINPGVSTNTITSGGNLPRTKVPPSVDHLLMQVGELTENLIQLSESLNAAFGDPDVMRDIVVNMRDLTANSSSLVAENKENITGILTNMKEITHDFTFVSQNLVTTSDNIDQIAASINSGHGTLGKLVQNDELYDSMVETMESLQSLTHNMKADSTLGLLMSDNTLYYDLVSISDNLKIITDEVASGRGSLGHLVKDDEMYVKLKETIENANRAAQGIEEQTPITVMGTILGIVW